MSNLKKTIKSYMLVDKKLGITEYKPDTNNIELIPYDKKVWEQKFSNKLKSGKAKLKNLQLTNVGVYSIGNPKIVGFLSNFLVELVDILIRKKIVKNKTAGKELIITDTHSGMGGFIYGLSDYFTNFNIVEINPLHIKVIKNNLKEYGITSPKFKIKYYNDNYLDVMDPLHQDIIISDPPWGGVAKRHKYSSMKHGINNINIVYIINELYKFNKFKIYIFLAMQNFDIQNFINNITSPDIVIKNMGKHYYIAVLNLK